MALERAAVPCAGALERQEIPGDEAPGRGAARGAGGPRAARAGGPARRRETLASIPPPRAEALSGGHSDETRVPAAGNPGREEDPLATGPRAAGAERVRVAVPGPGARPREVAGDPGPKAARFAGARPGAVLAATRSRTSRPVVDAGAKPGIPSHRRDRGPEEARAGESGEREAASDAIVRPRAGQAGGSPTPAAAAAPGARPEKRAVVAGGSRSRAALVLSAGRKEAVFAAGTRVPPPGG
jgi:hypothetical protein